jgi:hypothetical protein
MANAFTLPSGIVVEEQEDNVFTLPSGNVLEENVPAAGGAFIKIAGGQFALAGNGGLAG